jgi:ABC-type multidrug transport system fused ATPase/permease subunit
LFVEDEATSALDTASEFLVKEALDRIMVDRTVIIIAHRLSTIKNADQIAVLGKNGNITEIGTYNELINKNGQFNELVKRQTIDKDH